MAGDAMTPSAAPARTDQRTWSAERGSWSWRAAPHRYDAPPHRVVVPTLVLAGGMTYRMPKRRLTSAAPGGIALLVY
jgi:hypothetical protein